MNKAGRDSRQQLTATRQCYQDRGGVPLDWNGLSPLVS